jgi:hypothetical protein
VETANYVSSLRISRVDLLPFNEAARAKYRAIGEECALENLGRCSQREMDEMVNGFRAHGLVARAGRSPT